MKKILAIIFAFMLLLLSLCACSKADPQVEASSTTTTVKQPPTVPSTLKPTQTTGRQQETEPTTVPAPTQTEPVDDPEKWLEFAITRFLTDTNHNGVITPSDTLEPPGTLPAVDRIPTADQNLVGETVKIVLARQQQTVPFYYECCADGERLAVVVMAQKIPMLIIFETNLGGIEALRQNIQEQSEFEAKILSMTNISREEGNIYAFTAGIKTEGIPSDEIVDILGETKIGQQGKFVGAFGTDGEGIFHCVMKGSDTDAISEELQKDFAVFDRIFARFSLKALFLCSNG